MKKSMVTAVLAAAVMISGQAVAHGEKPAHGGVVSTANDISFELVNKEGKPTIYVNDHGKPVDTQGAMGKLTVLNGKDKTEVALDAAGGNTLAGKEDVKLAKGSKAVAAITFADKKTSNVRFAFK